MRKAENMADRWDDEEGVGSSSSHRLHGVRQAVKELMKEALHSKENSELLAELTESGPSDILTLTREKQRLLQEKTSCEVELELRMRLCKEPLADTTVDLEDLEERVAELEREVSAARSRLSLDQQLIQRLQTSEILTKHLFQRPDPTAEDKALREAVGKQCAESGRDRVMRIKRENDTGARDTAESSLLKLRLRRVLEAKTAECRLLRGCLQGLIVGSGVDWSEDEQLRDLTISLGHTSWEISRDIIHHYIITYLLKHDIIISFA
ncbi:hypothetical protein GBAR_LOCUS3917 [Geodia barretti]|uniref:Centromere protein H C-terminal domain-containing protein n=1 Tax=Geodia barretti TaxID=519541 RepID=A0AA35W7L1_GEOBA|nr:hypothetical protein GBAR_LOCUS3917 [Geodia barretti]